MRARGPGSAVAVSKRLSWLPARSAAAGLVLSLAACRSGAPRPEIPYAPLYETDLLVRKLVRQRVASFAEDPHGLFRPTDLHIVGDTLVVLDSGNDRVVVFDTTLTPIHAFGQRGAGPGEFQFPLHVEPWSGGYVVSDRESQRLSFFDPEGIFTRSVQYLSRAAGGDFAVGDEGTIYAIAPLDDHFIAEVGSDGSVRPFALRPPPPPDTGTITAPPFPFSTDKIVRIGDALYVIDNTYAVLHEFTLEGRLVRSRRFPGPVFDHGMAVYQKFLASAGDNGGQVFRSFVASGTVTPAGKILVIFAGHPPALGALIDPTDCAFRLLYISEELGEEDKRILRSPRSAVLAGRSLYVLHGAGISVFEIAGEDE